MPTLLVSGAGIGELLSLGDVAAHNFSPSAHPKGLEGWVGQPFVYISPATGANVNFNLTTVQSQSANLVRFDFDSDKRPIVWVSLGDQLKLGAVSVGFRALGIAGKGFDSSCIGIPRVSLTALARDVRFNFVSNYVAPTALNVAFYFDGYPIVFGVTAGSLNFFGAHNVKTTPQLFVVGIPAVTPFRGAMFVSALASLNFNFVNPYTPPSSYALRFDFDQLRPVPVLGISTQVFGSTKIENKAIGVRPPGLLSQCFGVPIGAYPAHASNVFFEFLESYRPDTGLNIAFAFGEEKAAHPAAFETLAFGTLHIYAPPRANPLGINSLVFGATKVRFSAVRPVSIDSLRTNEPTVGYEWHYIRPTAISEFGAGNPFVSHRVRRPKPAGWNSSAYGDPRVVLAVLDAVRPKGIYVGGFGNPTLRNRNRFIYVEHGLDFARYGKPTLIYGTGPKRLIVTQGADGSVFGTSAVSFYYRYLSPLPGYVDPARYGAVVVGLRTQHVSPEGFSTRSMGSHRVIREYDKQYVYFLGRDHAVFGFPRVDYDGVYKIQGFDSAVLGAPRVYNLRQYVVPPKSIVDPAFYGDALVWNRRQYVFPDSGIFLFVPFFGTRTAIHNRNPQAHPESIYPPRMPIGHSVYLGGRLLYPPSLGDTFDAGKHLIAHRVRPIQPAGINALVFYQFTFIHNAALQFKVPGMAPPAFSAKHRIWFNAQHTKVAPIYQDGYGLPFIAFGKRYLNEYFPPHGACGEPSVGHSPRYISPVWEMKKIVGIPNIANVPSQTVQPRLIVVPLPGYPTVHNNTPQIYPKSINKSEVGAAWVSHAPRTVKPYSISTAAYGTPFVAYRNRILRVSSINQWRVSSPTVWQEVDDKPYHRSVFPFSIEVPELQVSAPVVFGNPHPVGWNSAKLGSPIVTFQGCITRWDNPDSRFQFGIPSLNNTQIIFVETGEKDPTGWTKQRIEHHTIWCRFDTPQQARDNHPESWPWQDLGTGLHGEEPLFPRFGTARVTTPATQYIYHHHRGDSNGIDYTRGDLVGTDHVVESTIRYLRPPNWISMRFGYPVLNAPRKVWPSKLISMVFGEAEINLPPYRFIRSPGFDSLKSDKQAIELFNRQLYPGGFNAVVFGDNKPMVYHKPRGPRPLGSSMAVFGPDTWVSPGIRSFQMQGFDSFEEGYTFGYFRERMQVYGGKAPVPGFTVGDSLRMGTPFVRAPQQRIAPYMIPPPELCHPHSVEEVMA